MSEREPRAKGTKGAGRGSSNSSQGFSDEERAALKDTVRERAIVWGKDRAADERAVVAKIASLPEPDRALGERLHAIITAAGPLLSPRLWYGMPAYTKDGDVLCFFQPSSKFKARYTTLGFNDTANLDDGVLWPTSFAVKELTKAEEAKVAALVKKAVG